MKRGDLVILLRFRSARALDLPQPGSIGIILNAGVTSFEEMVPAAPTDTGKALKGNQ